MPRLASAPNIALTCMNRARVDRTRHRVAMSTHRDHPDSELLDGCPFPIVHSVTHTVHRWLGGVFVMQIGSCAGRDLTADPQRAIAVKAATSCAGWTLEPRPTLHVKHVNFSI